MLSGTSEFGDFAALSTGRVPAPTHATATEAAPHGYAATSGTSAQLIAQADRAPSNRAPSRRKPTPADRHALAEQMSHALANAKQLELSAASADPEGAAIAGFDLRATLHQLWDLRFIRSDDWATIVNKLQVVTSSVDFERFTREMAMAVRMVIESHLGPDADNDDVQASTNLLERADLHPWKCITGVDGDES